MTTKRLTVPIVGARAVDRALMVNNQRSINWRPEVEGDGAKSTLTLKPTPGMIRKLRAGNGPARSRGVVFKGAAYFVSGRNLVKVDTAWNATIIGTLNTGSGFCSIVAGRNYILVVDGGDGYTWDGTSFATVTDGDFPAAPQVCGYLDGFYIVNTASSDAWNISANEDPTSWAALDFSRADAAPDDAVGIVTTYRDVYLVGSYTTQVYYNSGNAQFPFDQYANGVLEFGTPAPFTIARAGGVIFMLAQHDESGLTVLAVNGFQAQRITDPDLADFLSQMDPTTVSQAYAYAYTEADQTFYVLTFPGDDITFVYHMEQKMWHEWSSNGMGRHRSLGYVRFNNCHLVGDSIDNRVYALDSRTYTDDGEMITRKRIGTVMARDGRDFTVDSFEIELGRGTALLSGQGSDPQLMFRYSDNGGLRWSRRSLLSLGTRGDGSRRAILNKLGQMSAFTPEISITDPVEAIVIAAYAEVDLLDA